MKEKIDLIIGMGEALWDLLPEGRKVGGAPANFAYHVSQFGLPGLAVSAVGRDSLGDELLAAFDGKGIDYHIDRVAYPTGTVQVEVDADGIPSYDIRENVAWDNIPYTDDLDAIARRTRAFCFGSLAQRNVVTRSTIARFLDAIPDEEGRLVVFDINLRQGFFTREIVADSMRRCNVLKINDEELVVVSRLFEYPGIDMRDKCRNLLEAFDLKMLILTCGVNGSYVFTREGESYLPTPRVEVEDTVGAGDSFTAAFVASMLRGKSVAEAHRKAVETSAYVCTCRGAMPALPRAIVAG